MNLLNKYSSLFVSIVAILAVMLVGSHFCVAFNHVSTHNSGGQIPTTSVSYSEKSNYQQCCTNKSNEQVTAASQQVQRFNLDTQNMAVPAFYSLPISSARGSSSFLQSTPQSNKPDPGGGLVLLC